MGWSGDGRRGGRSPRALPKSERLWFPTLIQPALGLRVCQSLTDPRLPRSIITLLVVSAQCFLRCVRPTLVSLSNAPTHNERAVSVVCWPVAAGAVPVWCVVCQSKGRIFLCARYRRPWADARCDCQWVSAASAQAASSRRQPVAAAPAGATLSRLLRVLGCCVDQSRGRGTSSDGHGSVSHPSMTAFQATAAATSRMLGRPRRISSYTFSLLTRRCPHVNVPIMFVATTRYSHLLRLPLPLSFPTVLAGFSKGRVERQWQCRGA